ncbi:MAG: prepilin-type N-terminal cleavage/methylation domain-containing protein [Gammaproteobacteria bacterium]|nr:prepilin-type N-terminal cleavage/methylation domain-containing protein [Gammaproteobacteria bacterium]
MSSHPDHGAGFSLVELLVAVAVTALLAASLTHILNQSLSAQNESAASNDLAREARFALERMRREGSRSERLFVPWVEHPNTGQTESVLEPGVLVVSLDPTLDRDRDGFADADNDKDSRVDEDWPRDANNDGRPGVRGINDNADGAVDFSWAGSRDDDESGVFGDEDPVNGIDDDGDGSIDEDAPADMNADGAPGILNVDDDGDGQVDEGDSADDDEDGSVDEDWIDTVAYFLSGTNLIERFPNINPTNGQDYSERVLTTDVSTFRVERLVRGDDAFATVSVRLDLNRAGRSISLTTHFRVGAAR